MLFFKLRQVRWEVGDRVGRLEKAVSSNRLKIKP